MRSGEALIALVLATVAFYPLYMFVVLLLDSLAGAGTLRQSFRYDSRWDVVQQLVLDWLHALPVAAAASATLVLPPIHIARRRSIAAASAYCLLSLLATAVVLTLTAIPPTSLVVGGPTLVLVLTLTYIILGPIHRRYE